MEVRLLPFRVQQLQSQSQQLQQSPQPQSQSPQSLQSQLLIQGSLRSPVHGWVCSAQQA